MTKAPKRRWFRFRLRTLLAAVSVCGVWFGYQVNWIHARRAMLQEPDVVRLDTDYRGWYREPHTPWSLRLFGERGVVWLCVPESELERAGDLFPEAALVPARNIDTAIK